jgi:patatin-related protein
MTAQRDDQVIIEDREELRIAVVMTGGVSLAVWMGGVAQELSSLVWHKGVYGQLLDLTGSEARVDVISGTSAGGLNGALLALAMARGRRLDALKRLWLEHGAMTELFRSPLDKDPPSFMRGDDYFLPKLEEGFRAVGQAEPVALPEHRLHDPIHLIMTTSLLRGESHRFPDDFGSVISEADHRGQFVFRRGSDAHHLPLEAKEEGDLTCIHAEAREAKDDFADSLIGRRLAFAARCSASFPGAFEPSLCQIGGDGDRVDMRCHASFRKSRFTIDGGVLVNKPLGPAIKAIYDQPADRQVRRVLLYIVPDPGAPPEFPPDRYEAMPTLGTVLIDSMVTLPRNQSISRELQEIQDRNEAARRRRRTRRILARAGGLEERASRVFEEYLVSRTDQSVDAILRSLEQGLARQKGDIPTWDPDRLRPVLTKERIARLPAVFPGTDWDPVNDWNWGLQPVEDCAIAVLDVLKRGMGLITPATTVEADGQESKVKETIRTCRARLHQALTEYRNVLPALDATYWSRQAPGALAALDAQAAGKRAPDGADPADRWTRDAFDGWPGDRKELAQVSLEIAGVLLDAAPGLWWLVNRVQADESASGGLKRDATDLGGMIEALVPRQSSDTGSAPTPDGHLTCLRLLLALHVIQHVLRAGESMTEQEVELIQVSAETPNLLGGPTDPGEKVTGIQLGHFGAFYKRSWRANDWMWGRLDAAYRFTQVLLNPFRLRQRRLTSGEVIALVEAAALGDQDSRPVLEPYWQRDVAEIRTELRFLDDQDRPLPAGLPKCVEAIARRLQLDIARHELKSLEGAMRYDFDKGATTSTAFADQVKEAAGGGGLVPPGAALRLFAESPVGREKVGEDAGSDLFVTTVGSGVAVGVSVAQGAKGGLPLRSLLASLRGFALALWVITRSAVLRGKGGAAVTSGILATGGALVALTVLAADPPRLIVSLGAGLLAAGLLFATFRAGALKAFGAFLLGIVVSTLPFLLTWVKSFMEARRGTWWADPLLFLIDHRGELAPIFLVTGLVFGSILLGIVKKKRRRA